MARESMADCVARRRLGETKKKPHNPVTAALRFARAIAKLLKDPHAAKAVDPDKLSPESQALFKNKPVSGETLRQYIAETKRLSLERQKPRALQLEQAATELEHQVKSKQMS